MLKNILAWYSKQDTLTQFLCNCGIAAISYFVIYRIAIDAIPHLQQIKNNIRNWHINNILFSAQKLLTFINIKSIVAEEQNRLYIGSKYIAMLPYCSGLMLTAGMTGFILAFPGRTFLFRIMMAGIGAALIFILNTLRITVIAAQLSSSDATHLHFVHKYHKTVYDPIVYAIVLLYIGIYVFKFCKTQNNK